MKSVHEASEAAWDPAFPAPEHPVLGAAAEGARGGEGEGVEGAGHTATRLSVQPWQLVPFLVDYSARVKVFIS